MNDSTTIVMGIIAMMLPVIAGRLVWRHFDQYCGRNDEAYQDTLPYFLKKIGATALTAFVILWIGISLTFNLAPQ